MTPWHPLIGDPDSAPDEAELDSTRATRDSQIVGSPDTARSPKASIFPADAGERATMIGERWFEDEPAFLQQPETTRVGIDRPAPPAAVPVKRTRSLRSLAVVMLRAVLASLEKDQ